MDKATAAEWLLRRVVDPARASELVGDQLESHPAAGWLRFWMSMAQLVLMLSWRTILGVAASPVVGLILALEFFLFVNPQLRDTAYLPERAVFHAKFYLFGVSILLWTATVISLVRLSWRDTTTRVGLTSSVLCSLSVSFLWQSTPAVTLAILWVAFIVFCMSNTKRRRSLGILCGAVVPAWLTAYALSVFSQDPYSIFGKWQGLMALFCIPIVEGSITMFLHRKFLASQNTNL